MASKTQKKKFAKKISTLESEVHDLILENNELKNENKLYENKLLKKKKNFFNEGYYFKDFCEITTFYKAISNYCIYIQKIYRGFKVRNTINESSTIIQKYWRRYTCKKTFINLFKLRWIYSLKIQKYWKRYIYLKNWKNKNAVIIQKYQRRIMNKKKYNFLIKKIKLIQYQFRKYMKNLKTLIYNHNNLIKFNCNKSIIYKDHFHKQITTYYHRELKLKEKYKKLKEKHEKIRGEYNITPWKDIDNKYYKSEPPDDFICKISFDLMTEPVMTSNGYTYEKESIEKWLKNHNNEPLTNEVIVEKNIFPNRFVKKKIDEWKEQNYLYSE